MKIGIIGTRGIPNNYGGFEQLAEFLSTRLSDKGHDVYVYNSHKHSYQDSTWKNVHIIHCNDPENKLGTAGQFIYDLNCILDSRKRGFDVLLALGYTSFSLWARLLPRDTVTVINMDGLEWKRTKYSKPVQRFLKYAERLAVRLCDRHIADSLAIQAYLKEKYAIPSEYIAYGAEIYTNEDEQLLKDLSVTRENYFMLMARMEPENNIEMILEGFTNSLTAKKLVVIGNTTNGFGQHMVEKFSKDDRIIFAGAIYDAKKIHTLKVYSCLYFHGHSVGGTNPSLLEAMASRALIAANKNPFNEAILADNAYYFSTAKDVTALVETIVHGSREREMINANLQKVHDEFNWDHITELYEKFLLKSYRRES